MVNFLPPNPPAPPPKTQKVTDVRLILRVRPGVRKESKNAASDSFRALFGLRSALLRLGYFGAPQGRRRRDTLLDSFRTPLGFRARRARETKTWWTFRIFLIFPCSGRGRGSLRRHGGEDRFVIEIPGGGGVSRRGGGRGRGAGRVSAANWGIFPGGAKFFFSGPKRPPRKERALCSSWGQKKHGNGNVQTKVRANNSGQFEGTAHENVGFRGKKGQKVHPNFAPNITMEFHYHAFCQGGENPVFGKPWFCLRDTRHSRHFRRFPGSEERNPLFLWVECKSSFSPFSVKTTCFR